MALLTVQQAVLKGTTVTYVAAGAGGDTFPLPHGAVALRVKNGSGAAITVTIAFPGTTSYGANNPTVVSNNVPAGGEAVIGPFPPSAVDPATGLVSVTYSATGSVTVAVTGQ